MSHLEETLAWYILAAGLPAPIREYHALDGRRYRWDFAWPSSRLLVEVHGGAFSRDKMGHNSGTGIHRDCEKLNLATLAGWRVLAVAEHHIRSGVALTWIREALKVAA